VAPFEKVAVPVDWFNRRHPIRRFVMAITVESPLLSAEREAAIAAFAKQLTQNSCHIWLPRLD
jgi:hypothetical protein